MRNDDIVINQGKATVQVQVVNTGDRPVQIGSHFHFFEVNKLLAFNREKALGMHLDIPAGTAAMTDAITATNPAVYAAKKRDRDLSSLSR